MDNKVEESSIQKANDWVNSPYIDGESKKEIQDLLDNNNTKEIQERFYKDLEFGTGGIRSIIGQGINRINKYTIRKATQALANEIKEVDSKEHRVAISYDSRRFSFEFAKETAAVLAANNIHAYIFKRLNPICLLSFSVRHHKAHAGVMVTASHNPPEYNGYKVFWSDGAQVTPPYDKNIINKYNDITDLGQVKIMSFEDAEKDGLIHWVGEDIEDIFYDLLQSEAINPEMCKKHGSELKFVYTAIHGSGQIPCTTLFDRLGLVNYNYVKEQAMPDGDFPTVSSPNPENPSALKLAVDLMIETDSDIAFGSDPDADRIGLALRHNGNIHYLSGNQIGSLLLNYICQNFKDKNTLPEKSFCIKTIVTTELLTKISDKFGLEIHNTLTGFKWLCRKLEEIKEEDDKKNFLFATEESFGYLNHEYIRDKDGVGPIGLLAEMTLWYKRKNMTLIDALDEIYEELGFFHEELLCLNYLGQEGAEKIQRIMSHFRANPPSEILGEEVVLIEDYEEQISNNLNTGGKVKITLPKSNVLGFYLKSGNKIMLRPSGTEPKIKFYIMLQEQNGSLNEKKSKAKAKGISIIKYLTDISDKQ